MGSEVIKIPAHWDCKPLVDCTSIKNISYGIVQPGQHDDQGVGIIRVNNFDNGYLNTSDVLKVSPSIEAKFSKTRLNGGEVLLTLVGSTGQSAIVPKELNGWNVPRAVAVIRPSNDVSAEWINICLQSNHTKHFLDSRANTTVQKTLNLKDVKDIPIPLPPIMEREKLESIVISLERKIQLNRQINQTLEHMAQALFKSWFVDFDPVLDNALDAGNPIPDELQERAETRQAVRKSEGFTPLPADVRQLFPAEFEQSELGWVPKGWEFKEAQDVASISIGKTPPRKESQWFSSSDQNNMLWVSIKDMGSFGAFTGNSSEYLTKDAVNKFNVKRVPRDSILLSFKLTLGRVAIAHDELTTNEAIAHFVRPKFELSKEFIYCYLSSFDYGTLGSTSSIATAVNSKIIKKMPILVPEESVSIEFKSQVKYLFMKMKLLDGEIANLTKLRDTLLPKLISGELRLEQAEAVIANTNTEDGTVSVTA